MTFSEYQQKALKTWNRTLFKGDWESNRITYLEQGLYIEACELLDIFNKQLRDGGEVDRNRVIKEIGDVCWFAAAIGYEHDVKSPRTNKHIDEKTTSGWPDSTPMDVAHTILRFSLDKLQKPNFIVSWIWFFAQVLCLRMGIDFTEVLQTNIDKLQDRARRGKINGTGDNR